MNREEQEETISVDAELEAAYQVARALRFQYSPSNDGSEDSLEYNAALAILRLARKATLEAGFREALEKIGHMFDHEECYGENALTMRDVALGALEAGDPTVARWPHASEFIWMDDNE